MRRGFFGVSAERSTTESSSSDCIALRCRTPWGLGAETGAPGFGDESQKTDRMCGQREASSVARNLSEGRDGAFLFLDGIGENVSCPQLVCRKGGFANVAIGRFRVARSGPWISRKGSENGERGNFEHGNRNRTGRANEKRWRCRVL